MEIFGLHSTIINQKTQMKNGMLDNQKQNIDGKEKERFFV
jgi:hypothetical protein